MGLCFHGVPRFVSCFISGVSAAGAAALLPRLIQCFFLCYKKKETTELKARMYK
jgi:hypothetical protein